MHLSVEVLQVALRACERCAEPVRQTTSSSALRSSRRDSSGFASIWQESSETAVERRGRRSARGGLWRIAITVLFHLTVAAPHHALMYR